jgi:hypothetical protein
MNNLLITLIGWFAWNVWLFSFTKDEYDDTKQVFPVKQYALEHYDNWLASLAGIPVLLVVGHYGLGQDVMGVLEVGAVKWSNGYYLASGVIPELAKYRYKKWKKSKEG